MTLSFKDERRIYCKQVMMHLMAIFSLESESFLSELQVDLNDFESGESADLVAITCFQKAIEAYKEALK